MRFSHAIVALAAVVAGQTAMVQAAKQRYRVTAPKDLFDSAVAAAAEELDIWHAALDGDNVKAEVYATEASIREVFAVAQPKSMRVAEAASPLVEIEPHPVDTQELLQVRAAAAATCTSQTSRHLEELAAGKYTESAFFDCYRTPDEIYAFFDQLVAENPSIFSKINRISSSVEGRPIPAYKLSTGAGKKAVYVQALAHAREWNSGTATFFTVASLLDGLRNKNATITPVVDKYDWYFVPIVNIDGFVFTHSPTGDRYWRKNRRPTIGLDGKPGFGVDLNRNYGPPELFNKLGVAVGDDTYPGPKALSEPETAGIFAFLKSIPLAGALDMHTFSYTGLVLRPLGNTMEEAPAPFGPKLKTLGDNVMTATRANNRYPYVSKTSAALYVNYGNFVDSVFLEFNRTPALCFEVEGEDFVEPERVIRPGAQAVFQGVVQFAKELDAYYRGL